MKSIRMVCPCSRVFKVHPSLGGAPTRCPACGLRHLVPPLIRDVPRSITKLENFPPFPFGKPEYSDLAKFSIFLFFSASVFALIFAFLPNIFEIFKLKTLDFRSVALVLILGCVGQLLLSFVSGFFAFLRKRNRKWSLALVLIISGALLTGIALKTIKFEKSEKETPEILQLDITQQDGMEDF